LAYGGPLAKFFFVGIWMSKGPEQLAKIPKSGNDIKTDWKSTMTCSVRVGPRTTMEVLRARRRTKMRGRATEVAAPGRGEPQAETQGGGLTLGNRMLKRMRPKTGSAFGPEDRGWLSDGHLLDEQASIMSADSYRGWPDPPRDIERWPGDRDAELRELRAAWREQRLGIGSCMLWCSRTA
jgi:hypothetical protein